MTRFPETIQIRVEREIADGNSRSARRLQAIPNRAPVEKAGYADAQPRAWAPLAGDGR